MIDLKKLGDKIDKFLLETNAETFELWLQERNKKHAECRLKVSLGEGHFENVEVNLSSTFTNATVPSQAVLPEHFSKNSLSPAGNACYAMAA